MKKAKIAALAAVVFMLLMPVQQAEAAPQGTKGDELQLVEAQKLEIRLGKERAGERYRLETDAGIYPGAVVVDEDGILKMEIGGSSQYILTRIFYDIGEPPLPEDDAPAAGEITSGTEPAGNIGNEDETTESTDVIQNEADAETDVCTDPTGERSPVPEAPVGDEKKENAAPAETEAVEFAETEALPAATTAHATDAPDEETAAPSEPAVSEDQKNTVAGIPVLSLALYGGGMVAAVGTLAWIAVYRKKHGTMTSCEDEVL